MNPEFEAEFQRLRPFMIHLHHLAKGAAAPLFWREDDGRLRNGTITFVDTGSAVLGITAGHVADECVPAYQSAPDGSCQIGGAAFDADSRFVARHTTLDLATFSLSGQLSAPALVHPATTLTWPPRPLQADELVLFGGFPSANREEGAQSIDFDFVSFVGKLDSASDTGVGLQLRLANCRATGPQAPASGMRVGGCSGGPMYRVVEAPVAHLELAAVVYEYLEAYEIIRAHSLTSVGEDGRFV